MAETIEDISFDEFECAVRYDPAIVLKILKVANSPLYAREGNVYTLQEAVSILGFRNVKSLVLLSTATSFARNGRDLDSFEPLRHHSIMTALIARELANRARIGLHPEHAYNAGLLHDIGKMSLYASYPERYMSAHRKVHEKHESVEKAEQMEFGITHRRFGGRLLRSWNLPEMYADIAEEHSTVFINSPCKKFVILITIADILAAKLGFGEDYEDPEKELSVFLPYTTLTMEDIRYFGLEFFNDAIEEGLPCGSMDFFNRADPDRKIEYSISIESAS